MNCNRTIIGLSCNVMFKRKNIYEEGEEKGKNEKL